MNSPGEAGATLLRVLARLLPPTLGAENADVWPKPRVLTLKLSGWLACSLIVSGVSKKGNWDGVTGRGDSGCFPWKARTRTKTDRTCLGVILLAKAFLAFFVIKLGKLDAVVSLVPLLLLLFL